MAGQRVISAVLTLRDRNFGSTAASAARSTRDLERRVQSTGNSVRQFGRTATSNLKDVALGAAGVATAFLGLNTIKNVATGAIEAASSLEGYRNTLNVVMGDQKKAAETMKWASDFANKTPFETDSVVEATVRLSSYGLEAKKVLPAIGDMAGVMNKDVMQAVEAVTDAQTGELERMKEFGITKAMIEKKAGEMFKGQTVVNNKGQIVEQEKFNKALFALMDDRFKGGMDMQANSFKGVVSNIVGSWKTGLSTMAGITASGDILKGGLFDTIKNKAKGLSDYMSTLSNNGTFEDIGTKISSGLSIASEKVGSFKDKMVEMYTAAKPGIDWIKDTGFPLMKDGIGSAVEKATEMYDFFKTHWPTISPIIAGVVASITAYKLGVMAVTTATAVWKGVTTVATVAAGLLNGTLALTPLGWIVIGIGAVVAAGVALYKNWDKVTSACSWMGDKLKEVWTDIKIGFSNSWSDIKTAAGDSVNFMLGKINDLIGVINKIPGVNIPIIPKVEWGQAGKVVQKMSGLQNIDSFAVGTNRVKRDMIANIHKDEMIIPAKQSQNLRKQGVTIDNIDKPSARNTSYTSGNNGGGNITFGNIIINGTNLTVEQIAGELLSKVKLRMANM